CVFSFFFSTRRPNTSCYRDWSSDVSSSDLHARSSWEPEVVVDLERWLVLRARIERAWLRGDTAQVYPGCPDPTIVPFDSAYVMCDGSYVAHVRNPGTAPPNLAAVQEMAAGILRVDSRVLLDQAELWV